MHKRYLVKFNFDLGSSTLPRNVGSRVAADSDGQHQQKVTNAASTTSLYDNVASGAVSTVQTMPATAGKLILLT